MTHEFPPEYQCGDLRICPAHGTITGANGTTVRLGPVNMKVLEALLARPGSVVSRAELFDAVWKNQVVSEDALTRCVSDIRAELRTFSGHDEWIETLPKRGYRWLADASAVDPSRQLEKSSSHDISPDAGTGDSEKHLPQRLMQLGLRGAGYLAALAAMAVVLVWVFDRLAGERAIVVALLPTEAGPEFVEQAAELDLALMTYFLRIDSIRVLSPSAIESRPANPFPFFAYEFGARWLIEAELRKVGGAATWTLTIADARTGIAEMQVSDDLSGPYGASDEPASAAIQALARFISVDSTGYEPAQ